ncbi:hypothetical protein GCM10023350_46570 [Nocardioides endophyticus]|uniref:Uncharacterized protein n=1 Tax=Nocardioides endophyticus TaxID=1353775 RepID=A0ABP8ZFS7_9ACTN
MNEHEMTDLLERVGSCLDPDVAWLVAGGAARGRTRRRRAANAIVAGVAAVAVVGALGYASLPGDEAAENDDTTAASSPTLSTDLPTQTPRQFGPEPANMGRVLGDLLVGDVTQIRAWHERHGEPSGFQAGSVLLDGAKVTVRLERTQPRPPCGELPPGAQCEVVLGGILSWWTRGGPASGNGPTGAPHPRDDELVGARASTATNATPDGFVITATAWAAGEEDAEGVAGAAPVLTEKQLVELVRDPVWLEDQQ